jgi:hypothetical protein
MKQELELEHYKSCIHNLTDYEFSLEEYKLLANGLDFIVTPQISEEKLKNQLTSAVDKWLRNLRVHAFFRSENSRDPIFNYLRTKRSKDHEDLPFIKNSTWEPPFVDPSLNTYCKATLSYLHAIIGGIHDPDNDEINISKYQQLFLIRFQTQFQDKLVIRPADKNLGLSVMTRQWYDLRTFDILSDLTIYEVVDYITVLENGRVMKELSSKLEELKNTGLRTKYLPYKTAQYLVKNMNDYKLPHMYLMPKIHKTPIDVRPIVSSHSWITTPASRIIQARVKPFVESQERILRESRSLIIDLENIRKEVYTNTDQPFYLCTADVVNMYPSIPIQLGLQYFYQFLFHFTGIDREEIAYIMELLKYVLYNNYIQFYTPIDYTLVESRNALNISSNLSNSSNIQPILQHMRNSHKNRRIVMKFGIPYYVYYYKQIQGTAMGTPVAPVYANVFMFILEQHAAFGPSPNIQTSHAISIMRNVYKPLELITKHIALYRRYLDDILIIASDLKHIKELIELLSNQNTNIRLTHVISTTEINYLDLTITVHKERMQPKQLGVMNYFNPIAAKDSIATLRVKPYAKYSHVFFPYHSFHPDHVKHAIITTELIRLARNSSVEHDFTLAKLTLGNKLLKLGYPTGIWLKYSKYVTFDKRSEFLTTNNKKALERLQSEQSDNDPILYLVSCHCEPNCSQKLQSAYTDPTKIFLVMPYLKETRNIHTFINNVLNEHKDILEPELANSTIFPPPITYTTSRSLSSYLSL